MEKVMIGLMVIWLMSAAWILYEAWTAPVVNWDPDWDPADFEVKNNELND